MALQDNGIYAIVNNVTGTVLDFTGNDQLNLHVMGWEWHGGLNQQWQLGGTGVADRFTLRNLRVIQGAANRLLRPQAAQGPNIVGNDSRLVAVPANVWQFFITQVAGGFTIRTNADGDPADLAAANLAVNIVAGDGVANINDNGPPVRLRPANQAQVWSVIPPANVPVTNLIQPGVYTIRNALSGTVLDLSGNVNAGNLFVMGWKSHGRDNQKWQLTRNNAGLWRFENLAAVAGGARHLTRELALAPPAGTRLIGIPGAEGFDFTIQNVPGTNDYQISSAGLALNIVTGAFIPPNDAILIIENGAPAVLQAAAAQTWAFVAVEPLA